MNITVSIPLSCLPDQADKALLKQWVIQQACAAAQAGLKPAELPAGEREKLTIYLPVSVRNTLLATVPEGMTDSAYIAGLLARQRLDRLQTEPHAPGPEAWQTRIDAAFFRREQVQLIDGLREPLATGKITLCEAGTGVGKTLVALASAAQYAVRHRCCAVFAVPTVAIIGQALRDYAMLEARGGEVLGVKALPPVHFVIGRTAFVSPERLRDALAQAESLTISPADQAAARAWLDAGGPAVEQAKSGPLHGNCEGLAWLAQDLAQVAPDFPLGLVTLAEDSADDCPAQQQYAWLRERSHCEGASVLICTHTMLALDVLRSPWLPEEIQRRVTTIEDRVSALKQKKTLRPVETKLLESNTKAHAYLTTLLKDSDGAAPEVSTGILPTYEAVMVDEGHELESNIARLRTSDFNPRMLVQKLKAKTATSPGGVAALITALDDLTRLLITFGKAHGQTLPGRGRLAFNQRNQGAEFAEFKTSLVAAFKGLRGTMESLSESDTTLQRWLREPLVVVRNALRHDSGQAAETVWINFSPERRYPSMETGPSSVRMLMERLWGRVNAGVVLSATLLLPGADGVAKPPPVLLRALAIPLQRLHVMPPLLQSWLYAPRLLSIPASRTDLLHCLEDNSSQKLKVWCDLIVVEMLKAIEDAVGGTLVLLTSYDRIERIGEALVRLRAELKPRLILQRPDKGVASSQADFERLGYAGQRPVWLATGGAWTGLDIRDKRVGPALEDAAQDVLLTDLVIPKLPFGTNHSTSHQSRMEYNFRAEADRAALEFKQGLGRLMRREGLLHRRIHLMDPRVWSNQPIYRPFRRIIRSYASSGDG